MHYLNRIFCQDCKKIDTKSGNFLDRGTLKRGYTVVLFVVIPAYHLHLQGRM
jgi:hypothetical protein